MNKEIQSTSEIYISMVSEKAKTQNLKQVLLTQQNR